ncbi:MAG TPA: LD-carboxypeptidase [Thermoanaerobaculia bacterium]|nr:LD-carboxypeptidase [Thermoanaerobaculia bacterium]
MLIKPRALPERAHIAVLAASGPAPLDNILQGARAIESRGHRVTLAGNIAHRHRHYLAGSDDERTDEVNRFLRDEQYDAFFFARGGYGAMRILDRIDYAAIAANPRPVVGFSDVTALHQAMATQVNVAGLHGPMLNLDFRNGLSSHHEDWFWAMLRGDAPLHYDFRRESVLVDGEAEGILFGGCLALTAALMGTPYDFWIDGGIWFWEDVDEPIYRIDRMLTHLRLSGRMPRIRGVIIGALKDCGEEPEMLSLLHDTFGSLNIPVVRNLPFGHHGNNLLMPIGTKVRLSTTDMRLTISEPAVVR